MHKQLLRIGSQLVDSGDWEEILNPFDQSVVGQACLAGPDEMDQAIALAADAFATTRMLPTHKRASILRAVADTLGSEAEQLAQLMMRESGKPIQFCKGEVARAQVTFRLAAGLCQTAGGEVMPIDLEPRAEGRLAMYSRVPRGPVAAISPFNFPLNLIAHKLAPAIAVGAPVVLKPPPQCPLTGYRLAEIIVAAGWPGDGLSVLHCPGEVAQRMVEDDRMKVLSFTGSDKVGWELKALAGKKQVLLELGGNAPCVVDETADLDAIMPLILKGAWAHAGQVCIKAQRIFVQERVFEDFLERFVRETKTVAAGDPSLDNTVIGPIVETKHVKRILEWIQEAVEGGATLHSGGTAEGSVVLPTILTGTQPDMKVCKEEVFGPVTVVEPFGSFEEALDLCNQGRFGLQAGLFTRDIGRALEAHRRLDYGGVLINDTPTFRVDNFPYGGTRDSGFGREGVAFAMEEMTEPRMLIMRGMPEAAKIT